MTMRIRVLSLILLSLIFMSDGCSFIRRKTRTVDISDGRFCASAIHYNPLTDSDVTIDPYHNCGLSNFGTVQRIPYSCASGACSTFQIDFSTACVRCVMCVAIAEEINQTLLDVHNMMAPDDWLNDTEAANVLRTICDHFFRRYNLRELNGVRFISDPLFGDKLLSTSVDGLWEKNLKSMCHRYLDEIQELQLYKNWQEWFENDEHMTFDLENVLCRNEISNLRDCRGIYNIHKRQVPLRMLSTRVKILAEYINCR